MRAHSEIQPQSVFYQDNKADQSSQSNISWYVESPSHGALLDNEALIEYDLFLASDTAIIEQLRFGFEENALHHPEKGTRFALRQGFAINRACESCTLNINGSVLSSRPADWMDQIMRFYAEPVEIETVCSMSGGDLDDGSFNYIVKDDCVKVAQFTPTTGATARIVTGDGFIPDAYDFADSELGALPVVPAVLASNLRLGFGYNTIPDADKHYNKGFTKRWHKMAYEARKQDGAANAVDNARKYCGNETVNGVANVKTVRIKVFERVPISPFMLWNLKDGRRSIPNVNRFTLNMQFSSKYKEMILQGNNWISQTAARSAEALTQGTTVDYFSTSPTLHLKWYIPPRGMLPKPSMIIPAQKILEFTSSTTISAVTIDAAAHFSPTLDANFNNIRLEQVPDMFLVYCKRQRSEITYLHPCDHNLEIVSMDVTLDGDSGKMLNASSADLYTMWLRNAGNSKLNRSRFEDWRRYHCVAALKPEDLGMKFGPGINHPITANFRMKVRSHHVTPTYSYAEDQASQVITDNVAAYDVFVVCIYDKYGLELRLNGSSSYSLQNMDKSLVLGSGQSRAEPVPLADVL